MGQSTKIITGVFAGLVMLVVGVLVFRVTRPRAADPLQEIQQSVSEPTQSATPPIVVQRPVYGGEAGAVVDGDNPAPSTMGGHSTTGTGEGLQYYRSDTAAGWPVGKVAQGAAGERK